MLDFLERVKLEASSSKYDLHDPASDFEKIKTKFEVAITTYHDGFDTSYVSPPQYAPLVYKARKQPTAGNFGKAFVYPRNFKQEKLLKANIVQIWSFAKDSADSQQLSTYMAGLDPGNDSTEWDKLYNPEKTKPLAPSLRNAYKEFCK